MRCPKINVSCFLCGQAFQWKQSERFKRNKGNFVGKDKEGLFHPTTRTSLGEDMPWGSHPNSIPRGRTSTLNPQQLIGKTSTMLCITREANVSAVSLQPVNQGSQLHWRQHIALDTMSYMERHHRVWRNAPVFLNALQPGLMSNKICWKLGLIYSARQM